MQQIARASSTWKILRACSPFDPISHSSRSPNLPLFVPKEIDAPSGETDQARAASRSLCGAPPDTEIAQMALVIEDHSAWYSAAGWETARNRRLSGNQAVELTCQTTFP